MGFESDGARWCRKTNSSISEPVILTFEETCLQRTPAKVVRTLNACARKVSCLQLVLVPDYKCMTSSSGTIPHLTSPSPTQTSRLAMGILKIVGHFEVGRQHREPYRLDAIHVASSVQSFWLYSATHNSD